jgi:mannose-6-phosphate isomerase-like protein (cupin superfamily)
VNEDQVRLNSDVTASEVAREVRVVVDDPDAVPMSLVETRGRAWALVWPGMGAHLRSMHRISLHPDGATIPLRHPMEAVYYVIEGTVEVHDMELDVRHPVVEGGMILVDPGTLYRFTAGSEGSEVVGGPSPADPLLYAAPETS